MTKKLYPLLIIVLVFSLGYSQNNEVEIIYSTNNEGFILSAKNNSNIQQEINLTITPTNLTGYNSPIKKLIPSNSTIEISRLFFIKNKKGSFRYNYSYNPNKTEQEKIFYEKSLKEKILTDHKDINKGIVVFSADGCSRCNYATSYLLDNGIDFLFLNTSSVDNYNKLMWELIKAENPLIQKLTMPVILIDGKISYNIKDLKDFVSKLKN